MAAIATTQLESNLTFTVHYNRLSKAFLAGIIAPENLFVLRRHNSQKIKVDVDENFLPLTCT
jgi:hypothetical protein